MGKGLSAEPQIKISKVKESDSVQRPKAGPAENKLKSLFKRDVSVKLIDEPTYSSKKSIKEEIVKESSHKKQNQIDDG